MRGGEKKELPTFDHWIETGLDRYWTLPVSLPGCTVYKALCLIISDLGSLFKWWQDRTNIPVLFLHYGMCNRHSLLLLEYDN
jgi:ABC-type molybdate transport system permease subunit